MNCFSIPGDRLDVLGSKDLEHRFVSVIASQSQFGPGNTGSANKIRSLNEHWEHTLDFFSGGERGSVGWKFELTGLSLGHKGIVGKCWSPKLIRRLSVKQNDSNIVDL